MPSTAWKELSSRVDVYNRLRLILDSGTISGRELSCDDCGYTFIDEDATDCINCGGTNIIATEVEFEFKDGKRIRETRNIT